MVPCHVCADGSVQRIGKVTQITFTIFSIFLRRFLDCWTIVSIFDNTNIELLDVMNIGIKVVDPIMRDWD